MISISTHVLDVATGQPAGGIDVKLESPVEGKWVTLGAGTTDSDGRVDELGSGLGPGHYRLRFDTGDHGSGFFPEVALTCNLDDTRAHYHLPLLLSPFGYTTYRGS
ncbi:MAG TPA: hydroxyisourate hydrolase [Acidimicrobiia bacterium]